MSSTGAAAGARRQALGPCDAPPVTGTVKLPEPDDVLVLGVHPTRSGQPNSIDTSLLETPPCDLLLTRTAGAAARDDAPAAQVLELAASPGPNLVL